MVMKAQRRLTECRHDDLNFLCATMNYFMFIWHVLHVCIFRGCAPSTISVPDVWNPTLRYLLLTEMNFAGLV
uniref:Uncharacterized protein n=1 Tax=Aegilops tauschii subsp. strangulata TaxID=200361 RepID=A0A453LFT1_AEGTS